MVHGYMMSQEHEVMSHNCMTFLEKVEIQFHTVTVGFLFLLGLSVVGGTFSKSVIPFYQNITLHHCWYHSLIVVIYFLLAVLIF